MSSFSIPYESDGKWRMQVKVADRGLIKTVNAETKVASPPTLQNAIDAEVGEHFPPQNSLHTFVWKHGVSRSNH